MPVMPGQPVESRLKQVGDELHDFAARLYPICRSITGDGLRETLSEIAKAVPLEVSEVPTGTAVFDWNIPQEWNIRDAFIKDTAGRRIVDFRQNNLHVLNYSVPVHAKVSLEELKAHIFTLPDRPDWIPYRTSYYQPRWGFCMTHNALLAMKQGDYEVCIDSTLEQGALSYGECYIPGQSSEEVLISTHVCHPSLANDNLSGVTVAVFLAKALLSRTLRYSYRFLFAPGTIGAITWLARNHDRASQVRHGLVLTCIGDQGGFHYKKSRRGDAEIDRAAAHVLRYCCESSEIMDFSPFGYDERQYCSPGFNLPVGCLMRSVWGTFPEYHTSADNLDLITADSLSGALNVCAAIVDILENNRTYINLHPHGEPQLGKRDLYRSEGEESIDTQMNARLWALNLCDGKHSMLDIAERSGMPFKSIQSATDMLSRSGMLAEVKMKLAQESKAGGAGAL